MRKGFVRGGEPGARTNENVGLPPVRHTGSEGTATAGAANTAPQVEAVGLSPLGTGLAAAAGGFMVSKVAGLGNEWVMAGLSGAIAYAWSNRAVL